MFSISASSFTLKHRDQKKEHRIPRPPNSFLVFRQKMQKQIQEKYQGANQRDMSKIISQWWHALKPKDKQVYADEAKKLTLEHKQRYPNYKFRPKRRKTKKAPRKDKVTPDHASIARGFYCKQGNVYCNGLERTETKNEHNDLQHQQHPFTMGCANTFDKDQLREKTRQTEALKHSAALATAFHHLNTDRMPRFECHVHQELQYYSPYFAIHSSLLCEEASDRTTTNHFLPTIDSTFSNAAAYSAAAYFETTHMDSSPLLDSTYHPFFTVGSNFSDASTTSTAGYSRSQSPFSVLDHQPQYDDVLLSNASFQTTIYSNPSLSSHFL